MRKYVIWKCKTPSTNAFKRFANSQINVQTLNIFTNKKKICEYVFNIDNFRSGICESVLCLSTKKALADLKCLFADLKCLFADLNSLLADLKSLLADRLFTQEF